MATVDLTQFHKTFFEESLEGLDAMEAALLALDSGSTDHELVHTIFRAAHSIKGGAATFGFADVAAFTHVAESLLEEVRSERRGVDAELIDLLLRSVDCLRAMLARSSSGQPAADADSEALRGELLRLASGEAVAAPAAAAPGVASATGWAIRFVALPHLLQTGNDPLRLFRELEQLGRLEVRRAFVLDSAPARLAELDPSQCHLGWELRLHGAVARGDVDAVFDWLDGDCELVIESLPGETSATAADPVAMAAPATAPVPAAAPPPACETATVSAASGEGSSIRVDIDKVDALINMMGELVITQSMLSDIGENFRPSQLERLREGLLQLERTTRELQESVMRIRMLPIGSVFNRFPRLVRDLERKLGKQVRLELHGEHTELDKTVLEKIGDPLVHLVRNAIDHGLELPAQRKAAGKPETGTLRLNAYHEGGNIVVQISDDGAGLNRAAIMAKAQQRGLLGAGEEPSDAEVAELIFQPGFSTAAQATDLSGRGVGMDVVRRNVRDLGGSVGVKSEVGKGSVFTIALPLTLAIIDGLVTAVGEERYIVPLTSIVESLRLGAEAVRRIAGGGEVFHFRGEYLPLMRLHRAFGCADAVTEIERGIVVVIEDAGRRVGLLVDDLLGQQQAVIKSLEKHYRRVQGVSGATILSDGSVALIVDVGGVVRLGLRAKAA
ncbi:chemotaxis protein CheA [Rhodanobacter thiooxydans]|uniref:Chemotaxis protein CheA n=1 Tax=Rhodanobacter thiooxydans TaxID=416169 RepID=A0A154QDV0_9GAMM|nr:chemotaxis protein CheA [Rhodanobacter thiooxydans]EIL96851.1 chemotaxis protein histidine kinase-like protein [Rhodanobacter thiooxydans LCS2]KZC22155.1 chemotaxis protein CheA [Rhodanobacter thiooxydans]MCW0201474.1 chemotaxis protein CheA [Rhodanobacter thiooxydans]